jgi:hypothetical protein
MNIGDKVKAKLPDGSFYKAVVGTITAIKNGYVHIDATEVMSIWDDKLEKHPTSCACSAKSLDVVLI